MGKVFSGRKKSREELINEAISLWRSYGDNYRIFWRCVKGIKNDGDPRIHKRITNDIKEQFPEIAFLKIDDENAALEYLNELEDRRIEFVIEQVRFLKDNFSYRTLEARMVDCKYGRLSDWRTLACPFGVPTDYSAHTACQRTASESE